MSSKNPERTFHSKPGSKYEEDLWKIDQLYKQGFTLETIVDYIGLSLPTVKEILKRIHENNSPLPKTPSKKIDETARKHMESVIRKNPSVTYNDLWLGLSASGIKVCQTTLWYTLKNMGYSRTKGKFVKSRGDE
ncbi:hypothetical protein INT47_011644 [Mucor saturninus]|uniref:Transposase n=1 Tax=Mucor saturninus TaxID=64648 RepID=A0A8H7R4B3_9FUNG|nr:hypothetical protein INT47_011644 [Mucor saturninus]